MHQPNVFWSHILEKVFEQQQQGRHVEGSRSPGRRAGHQCQIQPCTSVHLNHATFSHMWNHSWLPGSAGSLLIKHPSPKPNRTAPTSAPPSPSISQPSLLYFKTIALLHVWPSPPPASAQPPLPLPAPLPPLLLLSSSPLLPHVHLNTVFLFSLTLIWHQSQEQ